MKIKGKGTVSATFSKAGPIDTTTIGVTIQLGRTTFSDTLTLVQAPTLTSLRNTFTGGYNFGPVTLTVGYQTGARGAPPVYSFIASAPFEVNIGR